MTKYIVMERQFEYNDEIYALNCEDVGVPTRIFNTRKDAEFEARRLNLEFFMELVASGEIREYFYDIKDLFNPKGRDILKDSNYDEDWESITEETWKILADYFYKDFYFVYKLED